MKMQKCQRCNDLFSCNKNDIDNCQCNSIKLETHTNLFLTKTNYDCLCKNCLIQLNEMMISIKKDKQNSIGQELRENLDYYNENGLIVFNEYYHLKRGECCENECRHCAYGYKFR